jgi:hypothetical protein
LPELRQLREKLKNVNFQPCFGWSKQNVYERGSSKPCLFQSPAVGNPVLAVHLFALPEPPRYEPLLRGENQPAVKLKNEAVMKDMKVGIEAPQNQRCQDTRQKGLIGSTPSILRPTV